MMMNRMSNNEAGVVGRILYYYIRVKVLNLIIISNHDGGERYRDERLLGRESMMMR
jgi:hypothetical protein